MDSTCTESKIQAFRREIQGFWPSKMKVFNSATAGFYRQIQISMSSSFLRPLPLFALFLFASDFTYQPLSLSIHPCLSFSSSPELFHYYWRSDGFLLHTSTLSNSRSYRNVHRCNTFIPQSTRKYVCETSISHFDVSSHEKKGSRTNGKATDGIPKTGYGRNTIFERYNTASLQRYIYRLWASLIWGIFTWWLF